MTLLIDGPGDRHAHTGPHGIARALGIEAWLASARGFDFVDILRARRRDGEFRLRPSASARSGSSASSAREIVEEHVTLVDPRCGLGLPLEHPRPRHSPRRDVAGRADLRSRSTRICASGLTGKLVVQQGGLRQDRARARRGGLRARARSNARWINNVSVARRAWPGLPGYGLARLAERFDLTFRHHDALGWTRAVTTGRSFARAVGRDRHRAARMAAPSSAQPQRMGAGALGDARTQTAYVRQPASPAVVTRLRGRSDEAFEPPSCGPALVEIPRELFPSTAATVYPLSESSGGTPATADRVGRGRARDFAT